MILWCWGWQGLGLRGDEGTARGRHVMVKCVDCGALAQSYTYDNTIQRFWRRQWHPTPGLLSGKSHGWRSLEGCSPWGRWGSDTTEQLHFHFSLWCMGEGNGNSLQCSCLENPRDGGAWWAAVYGVTQSRTRLKWLSSSSSLITTVSPLLLKPHQKGPSSPFHEC